MRWCAHCTGTKPQVRDDGVMYVKGSTTHVVQTANNEMQVVAGVLVNRQTYNNGSAVVTTDPTANVLRTANYIGPPRKFTSQVSVRALMELKYLYVSGTPWVALTELSYPLRPPAPLYSTAPVS